MHAEANAEIRNAFLTRVLRCKDFPFGAAITETAGHQNAIDQSNDLSRALVLDLFGIDPHDMHLGVVMSASMDQRFIDRFVSILQLDVFSGHRDGDLVLGMDHPLDESLPALERRRWRVT